MNIREAPHGINLVVETKDVIYVGRFDESNGFQVLMHDCDVHPLQEGEDTEEYIRNIAKYGVAVNHRDITFDAVGITRVRLLGDIAKD
ncbi:MAG: hypothetical protein O7B99_03310 [Planctomycetota bacterium]|nr:hypothetical protein [Planctomycetota bacterium]